MGRRGDHHCALQCMLAKAEIDAYAEGIIIDWSNSLFVGDRQEDADCAKNAMIEFRWSEDFFERRVGVGA